MKDANDGYTRLPVFLLLAFCLTLLSSAAEARDVTFSWAANAEQVEGYRLYYKTGTNGGAPYDGTGVAEGNSPVNTGNLTSFTLHGLSDSETYYFVLTAFSGTEESDYSAEITLEPLPPPAEDLPPTADDTSITTAEDQPISGTVTASNSSGLPITYQVQQDVAHGTLSLAAESGDFTYAPVQDFAGTDTFTFLASDDNGDSNIASVSLTVTAVNDQPTVENTGITIDEDTEAKGQLQAHDPDGDDLTFSVVTPPSMGRVSINISGTFTYTPDADAAGTDSFTFQAGDGQTASTPGIVSITITPVNDPPAAENAEVSVNEDFTLNGQLHAEDPEGDSMTFSVVSGPSMGSLSITGSGAFTYTPVANAAGNDSFTFQVSDGKDTSPPATATITINPVNDAPEPQNDSLNAIYGQTASGTLQAEDVDNDTLMFTITSDPQHAVTLTDSETGTYTFTPAEGMDSPYVFAFTVNDGQADSNIAEITVTLVEPATLMEIFGDTPDSNHPGTLADTYTDLNSDIHASAAQLMTRSWSSTDLQKPANTIIIKTDLSSMQQTFQVTEAILYLYQTDATGDETYVNTLHRLTGKNPIVAQVSGENASDTEAWTAVEEGTTDNDTPLGLADILPAEESITLDSESGYKAWVITDMVQEWINDPTSNYGLLISGIPTDTATGRTFAASEEVDSTIRPKLEIHYFRRPPKPSVISAREIK